MGSIYQESEHRIKDNGYSPIVESEEEGYGEKNVDGSYGRTGMSVKKKNQTSVSC